jgi:hypothetical protein
MKKFLLAAITLAYFSGAYAQFDDEDEYRDDEFGTLFGADMEIGGYGGFGVNYTEIEGLSGISFHGRGAIIISHGIALGISGTGFLTDYFYDNFEDSDANLAGGYGGMFFEPIIFPKFPVHVSVPVMFGVGGVAYSYRYDNNDYEWESQVEDTEVFLVLEPGVELEVNLTRFFRMAFGGYYRITSNLDLHNTSSDALNGFSAGVTFKFGKF